MSLIRNTIFSFSLLLATQALVMCSSVEINSEDQVSVELQKPISINVGMSTYEVSGEQAEFQFTQAGNYNLSYTWTDTDGSSNLPSPEGLKFTVSLWNQNKEIYNKHFWSEPTYSSVTENMFLKVGKSTTFKPIGISIVGTVSTPNAAQRQGTLNITIKRAQGL